MAQTLLLGEDLLPLLTLAFGAALVAGNGFALIKPPESGDDGDLASAPLVRTVAFMVAGTIMTVLALASLLS